MGHPRRPTLHGQFVLLTEDLNRLARHIEAEIPARRDRAVPVWAIAGWAADVAGWLGMVGDDTADRRRQLVAQASYLGTATTRVLAVLTAGVQVMNPSMPAQGVAEEVDRARRLVRLELAAAGLAVPA